MKLKRMSNVLAPNQIVVICKQKSGFIDAILYHGVVSKLPNGLKEKSISSYISESNEIKIYVE